MLKENDEIRKLTNVEEYHHNNLYGQNMHVVIFDKKGSPHPFQKDNVTSPFCDEYKISHGTNVSSVILEMAPQVKITMLYSNEENREYFKKIAHTVDVVNISMSSLKVTAEHSWGFLEQYDIPVFCSSGNHSNDEVSYPSAFDWTVSVGAAYSDEKITNYSNQGNKLWLLGYTNVYVPNSDKKSFRFTGTSCSSPQVAGSMALYGQYLKQKGNKLTRQHAFETLKEYAKDLYEENFDVKSGYGIVRLPSLSEIEKTLPKEEPKPIPQPIPIEVKPIPEQPKPDPVVESPKENHETFYRVVTGSFSEKWRAEARVKEIALKGISSFLLAYNDNGKTMYRCVTGSFSDYSNSKARVEYLKQLGFDSFIAIYRK